MVAVLVGPSRRKFTVHRDLLIRNCPYFAGCLRTNAFSEGQEKKVTLGEDDPEAFSDLVTWLYRGRLQVAQNGSLASARLRATYILADKVCINTLKNHIMDMIRKVYATVCVEPTELTRDLGPEGCQMRNFHIRQFAYDASREPETYQRAQGKWDAASRRFFDGGFAGMDDIVADVKELMLEWRRRPFEDPARISGCHFHNHGIGESCSADEQQSCWVYGVRLESFLR